MEPVKLGSKNPVNDWVKKMKLNLLKKILSVVLTSTFLLSFNFVPANAVADGPVNCGTSGTFTVTSNVVTGNTDCDGLVNIPNGVTRIANDAFYETLIDSVNIPNTVTQIGDGAFYNTSLVSVTIPDSVTIIGEYAFSIRTLTSVTFGNGLTTIGNNAFAGTTANSFTFSGNAPASVDDAAFPVATPPSTANVAYNATGFPANGSIWKRLSVVYGSAPAGDSDSSSPKTVATIPPAVVKTSDAVFNLKNRKNLTKVAMKTKLSKNKSFKINPKDLYKYSIFKASKKVCAINGNNVTALKQTGTCDLYATRTTTKGVQYKYWVRINYTK